MLIVLVIFYCINNNNKRFFVVFKDFCVKKIDIFILLLFNVAYLTISFMHIESVGFCVASLDLRLPEFREIILKQIKLACLLSTTLLT